jgi:hypothetical protein
MLKNADIFCIASAVVRALEAAALAVVVADPLTALRLTLLASELRGGGR